MAEPNPLAKGESMPKKPPRECGCPSKLRRCHHELRASLEQSVSSRTDADRLAISDYRKRARVEKKSRKEVPYHVTFVQGGSPGTGKRS